MNRRKNVIEYDETIFTRLHIHGVKVEVVRDGDTLEGGDLIVDLSLTGYHVDKQGLRYPLISVWVDRSGEGREIVCKAHAVVPQENKKDASITLARNFAAMVHHNREQIIHHRPEMKLHVSDDFQIVRYAASEKVYKSRDSFSGVTFFENKAHALQAVFRTLRKHSLQRQVTGTDLINLNQVSDGVLEEIGFTKIPDEFERGLPMWMGDPERIISLGRSSYDEKEGRYLGWRQEMEKRQNAEQAVIDSFLDIMELELT